MGTREKRLPIGVCVCSRRMNCSIFVCKKDERVNDCIAPTLNRCQTEQASRGGGGAEAVRCLAFCDYIYVSFSKKKKKIPEDETLLASPTILQSVSSTGQRRLFFFFPVPVVGQHDAT